jgi:hypothetical protein
MKKIAITLLLVFSVIPAISQTLNGAWRLIEKDNSSVKNEVTKLYSNSYFTYSVYQKDSGNFIEAGGGRYILDFFNYREHYEIDSTNPERSGTTTNYKAIVEDDILQVTNLKTGVVERWEKIDEADDFEMTTCWRIHEKLDEGDSDWRLIEYGPRKTLKMLTNNYYQVLALNSETGKFVGSSGGTWVKSDDTYTENIKFFSKDQSNVGRSLEFNRKYDDGLWYHTGKNTKGNVLMEKWLRYK